jgi:hypothetical protein
VSERPILFSGAMVRAILAGTKTQTRRVIRRVMPAGSPNPPFPDEVLRWDCIMDWDYLPSRLDYMRSGTDLCPYGVPGDRLWVRETTESYPLPNILTGEPTNAICGRYIADHEPVVNEHWFDCAWWYSRPVCPAIHMPHWASRITLEIADVRVQRVQEISEEDARAEGICRINLPTLGPDAHGWLPYPEADFCEMSNYPRNCFMFLWDSINEKKHPWSSNPWVWALTFRRIQ